jgi:hypothetical protein
VARKYQLTSTTHARQLATSYADMFLASI